MSHQSQVFLPLVNGQIPAVGLGTWQSKPGEVGNAVQVALDAGYLHIDCAQVYANESEIGQVFEDAFKSGKIKRSDIWVTSKLDNPDHRPEHVLGALETTLRNLRLDYLDLYLIHWPVPMKHDQPYTDSKPNLDDVPMTDTWKAMEKLVHAGKVRHIGVSNLNIRRLKELLAVAEVPIAVNQVELHPYLPQNELLEFCKQHNIHVTAYSPLGSGRKPSLVDDSAIVEIAKKHSKTAAQVLIRWAVQRGTTVIPKSVTASRIKENLDVFDFELDAGDMKTLNELHLKTANRYIQPKIFWKIDVFEDDIPTAPRE